MRIIIAGAGEVGTHLAKMLSNGKWFLSALMLLGRLELLTVLILFSKNFYKS